MSEASRKYIAKHYKKKSESPNPTTVPPPTTPPQNPPPNDDASGKGFGFFIRRLWKRFWGVIVGVGVIACIIAAWPVVKSWFQSDIQKFQEEKTIQGELHFPKLTPLMPDADTADESRPHVIHNVTPTNSEEVKGIYVPGLHNKNTFVIWIADNAMVYDIQKLYQGLNIFDSALSKYLNTNVSFYIVAKDERVFVSVKINDLQTNSTIAIVRFNKFEIYKENVLDPNYNDSMFEVRDRQGGVALSLQYKQKSDYIFKSAKPIPKGESDVLYINGYFIGTNSIVVSGSTISFPNPYHQVVSKSESNWKEEATHYIDSIPSIFDKPFR